MSLGRFDTDSGALRARIDAHERFAAQPLEPWLLELLEPEPGQRCLELGAGTGRQTIPLAQAVGDGGHVVAVDVSGPALAELGRAASAGGVAERVTTVERDFDALAAEPCPRRFDSVLSVYALYYASDPSAVIGRLHEVLSGDGGTALLCGPGSGNNGELLRLIESCGAGAAAEPSVAQEFMEERAPALLEGAFGRVERFTLENPLRFDSAAALGDYWRSHNLHDPAHDEAFSEASERHFETSGEFVSVKRVVALRARKHSS